MINLEIKDFIDTKYKEYAYYTINNRAIPSIKDGLKPVQRRILFIAKKEAKDYIKVSNLAGKTLCIHPHGDASLASAISNMAQDFCGANNIPFLTGKGAFGSKILGPGKGVGAPRYVSVKINDFTKNVVYQDFDLVKTIPNYDGEYEEIENFLPLVPLVLLNGVSGIAVGFATSILPYKLSDIIDIQKKILNNMLVEPVKIKPYYRGFEGKIVYNSDAQKYETEGVCKDEKSFLRITELPIGTNREQCIKVLSDLVEKDIIKDFEDYSKEKYDIRVYPKRGKNIENTATTFKLTSKLSENLTLLDTNNNLKVYNNVVDIIDEFTRWRFGYIVKRYEKLYNDLSVVTDKKSEMLEFIKYVVDNDYISKMNKMTKKELIKELIGRFPNIAELITASISMFSRDSINILKDEIKENQATLKKYDSIIKSKSKQIEIFSNELDNFLKFA